MEILTSGVAKAGPGQACAGQKHHVRPAHVTRSHAKCAWAASVQQVPSQYQWPGYATGFDHPELLIIVCGSVHLSLKQAAFTGGLTFFPGIPTVQFLITCSTCKWSKTGQWGAWELEATLVSQATPFTERGRVWSRCNHRVVPTAETWCDQSDPRSS